MDLSLKEGFIERWNRFFPGADLPIAIIYTDREPVAEKEESEVTDRCMIGNLMRVIEGKPFVYEKSTAGCPGGKRYSGFVQKLRPDFRHFLSCGIPGKMEGERYKESPELVDRFMETQPPFEAPGKYVVFKRWDQLEAGDEPCIVVFFARPDVLSGLFTLANFDWETPYGVVAPMGAGCATIIGYPLREAQSEKPRCVLGMFDVSARPSVAANTLSFAIPFKRFETLVSQMDESFLITGSWEKVTTRWSGESGVGN
jgi:hypothetical protein